MPELIEVGRTGMLVEDFVEGYHQIEQCFEMDRAYIAHRARLLFNYQTMTKRYVRAYERVAGIFETDWEQGSALRALDLHPQRDDAVPEASAVAIDGVRRHYDDEAA